ncbi:hypothetical protein C2E23DRAFT_230934 [Lenzites betulinus]|nr:hypothetical protein C2E23DRAFT_230934 [Lenzites betulinus]
MRSCAPPLSFVASPISQAPSLKSCSAILQALGSRFHKHNLNMFRNVQQLNSPRGAVAEHSPPATGDEYIAPPWQVARLGQRIFPSRDEYYKRVKECFTSAARSRPASVSSRVKEWEARDALIDAARVRRAVWQGKDPEAPSEVTVQPRVEIRKRPDPEESTLDTGLGIKRCIRSEEEEAQVVADITACVCAQAEEVIEVEQAVVHQAPANYEDVVVRVEESDSTPLLWSEPAITVDLTEEEEGQAVSQEVYDNVVVRIEESDSTPLLWSEPATTADFTEEEEQPVLHQAPAHYDDVVVRIEESDSVPFLTFEPTTVVDWTEEEGVPPIRIEESCSQVHAVLDEPKDEPYVKEEVIERPALSEPSAFIKAEDTDGTLPPAKSVLPIVVKDEPREDDAAYGQLVENVSTSILCNMFYQASISTSVVITAHYIPPGAAMLLPKLEPKDSSEDLNYLLEPHHPLPSLGSDVEMTDALEGLPPVDEDVIMSESIHAVEVSREPRIKEEDNVVEISSLVSTTPASAPHTVTFAPAPLIKSSGSVEEITMLAVLKTEPVEHTLPHCPAEERFVKLEPVDVDVAPLRRLPLIVKAESLNHLPCAPLVVKSESLDGLQDSMEDVDEDFPMAEQQMSPDVTHGSPQSHELSYASSFKLEDIAESLPATTPNAATSEALSSLDSSRSLQYESEDEEVVQTSMMSQSHSVEVEYVEDVGISPSVSEVDAAPREVLSPLRSSLPLQYEYVDSVQLSPLSESESVDVGNVSTESAVFWGGRSVHAEDDHSLFVVGAETQRSSWRSAMRERANMMSPSPSRSPTAELQHGAAEVADTAEDWEENSCLSLRDLTPPTAPATPAVELHGIRALSTSLSHNSLTVSPSAYIDIREPFLTTSASYGFSTAPEDIAPSPEFASNFAQAQLPSLLCYSAGDLALASRYSSFHSVIEQDLTDDETASSSGTEDEACSTPCLDPEASTSTLSLCGLQYTTPYVTAQDFFDESFDSVLGDQSEDDLYSDGEVISAFPKRGEGTTAQVFTTSDASESPRDPFEEVWQYARACYYASKAVQYGLPKDIVSSIPLRPARELVEDQLVDSRAPTERVSRPLPERCTRDQVLETDTGMARVHVEALRWSGRIPLPTIPRPVTIAPFSMPPAPIGFFSSTYGFDTSRPTPTSTSHLRNVGPVLERMDTAARAMGRARPGAADLASIFEPRDATPARLGIFVTGQPASPLSERSSRAGLCSDHEMRF